MVFNIFTIFPEFFSSILEHGLLRRAIVSGQLTVGVHDLRDFTDDRHHTVDDRPFGGGPGMVFKPEPIFRAVEALKSEARETSLLILLLSPRGRLFSQAVAEELAREPRVGLICGRYEGVDERVAEHLATDEISIGDYVLSGGELPAAVVIEAVARLLPGVLGNEESLEHESFALPELAGREGARGLLDFPHYTRPAEFRGMRVPDVLLSGNHDEIGRWRRRRALEKTLRQRADLLDKLHLSDEDRRLLDEIRRAPSEAVAHEP